MSPNPPVHKCFPRMGTEAPVVCGNCYKPGIGPYSVMRTVFMIEFR